MLENEITLEKLDGGRREGAPGNLGGKLLQIYAGSRLVTGFQWAARARLMAAAAAVKWRQGGGGNGEAEGGARATRREATARRR